KWRSLANWEDSIQESLDEDVEYEDGVDVDSLFYDLAAHLCRFIGIDVGDATLQSFSIYNELDSTLLTSLKKKRKFSRQEIKNILEKTEAAGAHFIADEKVIILREI